MYERKKKRQYSPVTLIAILVLTCTMLGTFFLPELVSAFWHLRHGKSVTFHGWMIPVPSGWWAYTYEDKLIIQKMTRVYEHIRSPEVIILPLNSRGIVNDAAFGQQLIRDFSKNGYSLQLKKAFKLAGNTVSCFEFADAAHQRNVRISCWSLDSGLSLDFLGYKHNVPVFYSVVDQIRLSSDASPQ